MGLEKRSNSKKWDWKSVQNFLRRILMRGCVLEKCISCGIELNFKWAATMIAIYDRMYRGDKSSGKSSSSSAFSNICLFFIAKTIN